MVRKMLPNIVNSINSNNADYFSKLAGKKHPDTIAPNGKDYYTEEHGADTEFHRVSNIWHSELFTVVL